MDCHLFCSLIPMIIFIKGQKRDINYLGWCNCNLTKVYYIRIVETCHLWVHININWANVVTSDASFSFCFTISFPNRNRKTARYFQKYMVVLNRLELLWTAFFSSAVLSFTLAQEPQSPWLVWLLDHRQTLFLDLHCSFQLLFICSAYHLCVTSVFLLHSHSF